MTGEIKKFEEKIKEQEDQLFGIKLFFDGLKDTWRRNKPIIAMNKFHFTNIMNRGKLYIQEAKKLLNEVKQNPEKTYQLKAFIFPPIKGSPMLDEITKRAKILVETYNKLFPERPRDKELTEEERLLLKTKAIEKF